MFLLLWCCTLDYKVVIIICHLKKNNKAGKIKRVYLHLTYHEYFFYLHPLTDIISFTFIIFLLSKNKRPYLRYTHIGDNLSQSNLV